MNKLILIALVTALVLSIIFIGAPFLFFPGYCGWPAKAQCRLCEKKIWVWQSYARQEYEVVVDDERFGARMNGLVHDDCEGTPYVKIGIQMTPTEDGFSVYFDGLKLRPQEVINARIVTPKPKEKPYTGLAI